MMSIRCARPGLSLLPRLFVALCVSLLLFAGCGGGGGGGGPEAAVGGGSTSGAGAGTGGAASGGSGAGTADLGTGGTGTADAAGGVGVGGTGTDAGGVGVGGTGTFDGGVGVGGTGTYAIGPIRGFGSIVVGGVRYDDRTATLRADDGSALTRDALQLGMFVEVDADAVQTDALGQAVATARGIRVERQLVGRVSRVDAASGALTVLGQTVRPAVDTVLGAGLGGQLSTLTPGSIVVVHALYDAARGEFTATRVDLAQAGEGWTLRAPVTEVDAARRRLRIGAAWFDFSSAENVPTGLSAGQVVRLRLAASSGDTSPFTVRAFARASLLPADREELRVEGRVTAFASVASFAVEGVPVDASGATWSGASGTLALGGRVEVEGRLVAGVLVADEVEIDSDDEVEQRGFELEGRIDSVDASERIFVLRGTRVGYGRPDLQLENGQIADLVAGRKVHVKAVAVDDDRSRVDAIRIEFEDD